MGNLFQGLYLSEVVLLVLGVVLFLVILAGLVAALVRGKPYIKLLPFFFVSIVMIAYPTIQSFKISATELDVDTYSKQLQDDPTSAPAREMLSTAVAKIASRPFSDPEVLTNLARGQLMLNEKPAATANLQKALQVSPAFGEAVSLQKRIQIEDQLPALTEQVKQSPGDAPARSQLQESLTAITETPVANPETLTTVAKAQAALGDKDAAIVNVNKVLTINPQLADAAQLKTQIGAASPKL